MYDETKLEAAVDAWVKKRAKLGYGQHYTRDLLADFESFLAETAMLQASPGLPAFGRQLTRIGLGTRRLHGVTYRTGIALLTPPPEVEREQYTPTKKRRRTAKATQTRVAKATRKKAIMSDDERAERKRQVKERMAAETAEKHRNVEQEQTE